MAKEKDLMRQKVNVTPGLIESWKKNMPFILRHLINPYLIKPEDAGKTFELNERTFTILGMTENDRMIVTEDFDGHIVYWECTTNLVQMCLGRFYHQYVELNGKETAVKQDYSISELHLPSLKDIRKKKEEVEETVDEDNSERELTYIEDTYQEEEM